VKRIRSHLTYANVISTLCLFLLLGGAAYATGMLPKNSVGTKQIKNGAVTQQKISASAQSALRGLQGPKGEKGEKGDRGEKGEKGETGDPGAPAVTFWAVYEANGTVLRSSGFAGQEAKAAGVYHPFWEGVVSTCSYSATLRNGADDGATISVDLGAFPDTLDVDTFNAAAAHDEPFSVQVFC
jgi:hypothetical protein